MFPSNNFELVQYLSELGHLKSQLAIDAFSSVDRKFFCNTYPYAIIPQGIGNGATISAPDVVADAMSSIAEFCPDGVILDVGAGSGYTTALIGAMNPRKIYALDHIDALLQLAQSNLKKCPVGSKLLKNNVVEFVLGDGRQPFAKEETFDAIHVGATWHINMKDPQFQEFIRQLKVGGRLVVPICEPKDHSEWLWVIDRTSRTKFHYQRLYQVVFIPLTTADRQVYGAPKEGNPVVWKPGAGIGDLTSSKQGHRAKK